MYISMVHKNARVVLIDGLGIIYQYNDHVQTVTAKSKTANINFASFFCENAKYEISGNIFGCMIRPGIRRNCFLNLYVYSQVPRHSHSLNPLSGNCILSYTLLSKKKTPSGASINCLGRHQMTSNKCLLSNKFQGRLWVFTRLRLSLEKLRLGGYTYI